MRHWIWQPVTYMFLHDVHNLTHILFNMLGLWMFGVELERQWGTRFFVKYYAITGIGAGLTTILVSLLPFHATSAIYYSNTIGASGALYGLLLAFALYYPNRPILMFLLFPVPAKYFVMILGAIAFLTSISGSGAVAATTHLGGLLVGYIYLNSGRGGFHGRDQVPLHQVEDEPDAPEVRRLFRRPLRLGQECALIDGEQVRGSGVRGSGLVQGSGVRGWFWVPWFVVFG